MTYAQVVAEAIHFPRGERLKLIEALAQSLRDDLALPRPVSVDDKRRIVERLGGILKTALGDLTPDWDWKIAKAQALADERPR